MKKLFFLILLIPSLIFGQSERDQKLAIKYGNKSSQTTSSESSSKSKIKEVDFHKKTQKFGTHGTFDRPVYYDYDRYNWVRWGAPVYGYSTFQPIYYYDRFGFRQPGRIYSYTDGRRDTIRGEKKHWRLGLSFNSEKQMGGWFSYGNKTFFMFEYCSYVESDKSSFIPDLTMSEVIPWNDKRLDDLKNGGTIYAGGGFKLNKFGIYIMPGYGWGNTNFQFFDEYYILSNNGKYSFPNYSESYLTGKFGVIYDYKYFTSKLDYNPFRNDINIGVGIVL